MSRDKWAALARIADAKFQKQAQSMEALSAEMSALSDRRSALDDMNKSAQNAFRDVHPLHYHSGDVQWQAWVGKNLRQMNIEAAHLHARRESLLPALRKAFGQKLACEELAKNAKRKASRSG